MKLPSMVVATMLLCRTAVADAVICNHSNEPIDIAIAYPHQHAKDWESEGWWHLTPEKCETLVMGPLPKRLRILGTTRSNVSWNAGTKLICTRDKAFTLFFSDQDPKQPHACPMGSGQYSVREDLFRGDERAIYSANKDRSISLSTVLNSSL